MVAARNLPVKTRFRHRVGDRTFQATSSPLAATSKDLGNAVGAPGCPSARRLPSSGSASRCARPSACSCVFFSVSSPRHSVSSQRLVRKNRNGLDRVGVARAAVMRTSPPVMPPLVGRRTRSCAGRRESRYGTRTRKRDILPAKAVSFAPIQHSEHTASAHAWVAGRGPPRFAGASANISAAPA